MGGSRNAWGGGNERDERKRGVEVNKRRWEREEVGGTIVGRRESTKEESGKLNEHCMR